MRLPKQVLVIPYKIENEEIKYCIFKRRKMQIWQWIAGGVEDFDNDILAAAKRESLEEANISNKAEFIQLEAFCRIPVVNVCKTFKWGEHVFYSDEYSNKEKDQAALEAGYLLVYQILENTEDRTGLIETCKNGGTLTSKNSTKSTNPESEKDKIKEALKEALIELLVK